MINEKRFGLALQRGLAALVVTTFLFASCTEDEFECTELDGDIGGVCIISSDSADIVGIINENCECTGENIGTENPGGGNLTYDCADISANFGDSCTVTSVGVDYYGLVTSDCDCDADTTPVEYDCPDQSANFGDACTQTVNGINYDGIINSDCDCEADIPTFDCPDLLANIGDSCVVITSDSLFTFGIISSECDCN